KATEVATGETVPNLLNMTTREVLRRVSGQQLKVKFVGQGTVSEVSPSVGSLVPENKEITVIMK
ncbi:MAG: PASTA domain-containing protein, partial [Bdellovibrio sp.]|nr:PASTA domain-containing protein [Bdellovibrio sp.]